MFAYPSEKDADASTIAKKSKNCIAAILGPPRL